MTDRDLRILIAGDQAMVRKGLIAILHQEHTAIVVGEAADADEAIDMALNDEWHVMVLDLSQPDAKGMGVLLAVKAAKPALPVVMLSMRTTIAHAHGAINSGASAYVFKETAPDELLAAVDTVLAGKTYNSCDRPKRFL